MTKAFLFNRYPSNDLQPTAAYQNLFLSAYDSTSLSPLHLVAAVGARAVVEAEVVEVLDARINDAAKGGTAASRVTVHQRGSIKLTARPRLKDGTPSPGNIFVITPRGGAGDTEIRSSRGNDVVESVEKGVCVSVVSISLAAALLSLIRGSALLRAQWPLLYMLMDGDMKPAGTVFSSLLLHCMELNT